MTWSEFFEHPVVKHEPNVYRELIIQLTKQPNEFFRQSETEEENQSNIKNSKNTNSRISQNKITAGIDENTDYTLPKS